ncbi:MAG: WYL domain-containing protein [Acidimicrobiia bacterium]|nr:WYL domain-containing protein [Acidimicrobiia bacterium]MBP8179560.1 WYL domain-containing protein [Acidimicrobiia bacterium]
MAKRTTAEQRLQRALAMLPWIAQHPWVSLEELAVRFGTTVQEAEADLGLLSFCGLPPYTPDRLITVDIVAGEVRVRFAEYFDRPVRLTAEEGLALAAAGQRLLDVPGSDDDGPLAHALDKLKKSLGTAFHVTNEASDIVRTHLAQLNAAIANNQPVTMTYYTAGRDSFSTREVDPLALLQHGTGWYLEAFCHRAEEQRTFRVDRIVTLDAVTDHPREISAPTVALRAPGLDDDNDSIDVRIRLSPAAKWLLHAVPATVVLADERGWEVVIRAADGVWIEQLLLRLGAAAEVIEPAWLSTRVAERANTILRRYSLT